MGMSFILVHLPLWNIIIYYWYIIIIYVILCYYLNYDIGNLKLISSCWQIKIIETLYWISLIFFWFFYFRIHLPGSVLEDESTSGQYNSDTGEFVFNLLKSVYGQYFEDLDLIGKLLQPRRETKVRPSIEVLGEDGMPWKVIYVSLNNSSSKFIY